MKIEKLAEKIGAKIQGDPEREIIGSATLTNAKPNNFSFYHNRRYKTQLLETDAGAVILAEKDLPEGANFTAILSQNPLDDFRKAVELFHPLESVKPMVSNLASIHPEAKLPKSIRIEPFVVVGKAELGDNTAIGANSVIGDGVSIGENCIIYPGVVIYPNTIIGNRVIIHSGAVVGSDGFGYSRTEDGVFHKIPQTGRLVIEDDVEIGANTAIDRGAVDDTVIGKGTKIDNLVQIGHNVIIGENCALAGQVGIAGSCKLGKGVLLGGQAGLAGHLELADGVVVFAQAGVDKSFDKGIVILGSPARPSRETLRQWAAVAKLPDIIKKMNKLTDKNKT